MPEEKKTGRKKGFFSLLKDSILKSNEGCGPGCGCHVAQEKPGKGNTAGKADRKA